MKDFEKNFENALSIRLTKVEKSEMFEQPDLAKLEKSPLMEFHVSKAMRDKCDFDLSLFATTGNVILTNFKNVRLFAKKIILGIAIYKIKIYKMSEVIKNKF